MSRAWCLRVGVLALLSMLLGCSDKIVEVTVLGLTDDITQLSVSASLRDRPDAGSPQAIQKRIDSFLIRLPVDQGALDVKVGGRGTDGCLLAQGELHAPLPVNGALQITLSRLSAPACRISVELIGEGQGRVESDPPGLQCPGVCDATFPPNSQVQLRATPNRDSSYFTGWTLGCTGLGTCTVSVGDVAVPVLAGFLPTQTCSGAFCWENPQPHGNAIHGLWARTERDVWAVGAGGLILRWFGSFWAPMRSGTSVELRAVYGQGDDVWVVGDEGTVLHWDGARFNVVPTRTRARLRAVLVRDATDVWVAGDGGTLLRGSGGSLSAVPGTPVQDLYSVSGRGTDVWVVGDGGTALRWNGAALQSLTTSTTKCLRAVKTISTSDVYMVGDGGLLLRWDGLAMQLQDSQTRDDLYAVWGTSNTDLWAAGLHGTLRRLDGTGWHSVSGGTVAALSSVSGAASGDVWAAGEGGTLLHWNGAVWVPQWSGDSDALVGIGPGAAGSLVAVSRSGLLRQRVAGTWHRMANGPEFEVEDAWSGPGQVWGVGSTGNVMQWKAGSNGSAGYWFVLRVVNTPLYGVAPRSSDPVADAFEVWAVGSGGNIVKVVGPQTNPSTVIYSTGFPTLRAISWIGSSEAWAVGDSGTVVRIQNSVPSRITSGTTANLRRVFGVASNDVWIVGEQGTILHWNGAAIAAVPGGGNARLSALWGSGANDVWSAGDGGVVLHWDGIRWSGVESGTSTDLLGITGSANGPVFLVGKNGTILSGGRTPSP